MITEDYVSFEVAKLLKEKGFDGECDYLYVNGNIVRAQGCRCNWNKGETIFTDYKNECSAPTLQMVMKWLRNKYKMFVLIEYSTFDFDAIRPFLWSIREMKIDGGLICGSYYSSYEKACEAAIKYALENLI